MWLSIIFIKMCLFHYVAVLGTAQWLGLSDYKPLSLPIALILVAVGVWTAPNLTYLNNFFDGEAFCLQQPGTNRHSPGASGGGGDPESGGQRGKEEGAWERDR